MNTTNQTGVATLTELAAYYKKAADEKMAEISRLEAVSQDTAYREGFRHSALCRAQQAAETDKVFLGGYGKGVLVLGISALGFEKAKSFIAACGGWKSHANGALTLLDGEKGEIRKNAKGTCWVIDLASSRRTIMFSWSSGPRDTRLAGPKLNTTNGGAHWCGLVSETMPFNRENSPVAVSYIKRATTCLAEHGMTPNQWERVENARRVAESERHAEIVRAAAKAGEANGVVVCVGFGYNPTRGEQYILVAEEFSGSTGPIPENLAELVHARFAAAKLAAEEKRIMEKLEAEQAELVQKKAKAEAEAKQQAAIEATCRAVGISLTDWQAMTPKKQGQALHRARLARKI
ncbi:MAG: hypothetical protein A2938_03180 [Candidatus Taylorbacteria bacterium RIFCSPLOWO2_01_FULL_48_100]|uniref:Uncharacterized protein n=1 Tax=Candidatus Taylorbacteria bacterium RIFCSPLOWO2_01_FULL_48_100 TaxID=1802322 RepID=A0A1G2NEM0_9BACT|nr:MAG: hypothetical protein A2670_00720 [Candidatus Taylorbacteria bacterium RIFCSPHIGHO2_01_FULL_48_38]OHA34530.1 MAG: hypothetical protein A2938_03180 [Candidatus Taylorbacteria bacterium RIFCSPLOWO2_01_FULL_48_100]